MARWAAFLGLTAVVLSLLLALARLSQDLLREGAAPVDGRTRPTPEGAPGEPAVEPPGTHDPAGDHRPTTEEPAPLSAGALLANVAFTQGLFGAVLVAGAVYTDVPAAALGVSAAPDSTGLPAVLLGAGLGVGLYLANEGGAALAEAAGFEHDELLRERLAPETHLGWLVLLVGVLPVIAGAEELLFRAAIIGAPSAGFGTSPWALAVVSSLAFALGHGAQGVAGVVVTGLLGFALGAAFVLTGSLLVVVLAHYLVNALEFLVHEGIGVDRFGG